MYQAVSEHAILLRIQPNPATYWNRYPKWFLLQRLQVQFLRLIDPPEQVDSEFYYLDEIDSIE